MDLIAGMLFLSLINSVLLNLAKARLAMRGTRGRIPRVVPKNLLLDSFIPVSFLRIPSMAVRGTLCTASTSRLSGVLTIYLA